MDQKKNNIIKNAYLSLIKNIEAQTGKDLGSKYLEKKEISNVWKGILKQTSWEENLNWTETLERESSGERISHKLISTDIERTSNIIMQRPKKCQLSGRQTFSGINFPDEACKSFPRHICQKCINRFYNINAKSNFCV